MMKPEMTKNTSTPAIQGSRSGTSNAVPARVARFSASCCACRNATDRAARARSTWTWTSLDTGLKFCRPAAGSGLGLEERLHVGPPRHRRDGALAERREGGGGVGVGGRAERVAGAAAIRRGTRRRTCRRRRSRRRPRPAAPGSARGDPRSRPWCRSRPMRQRHDPAAEAQIEVADLLRRGRAP